MAKAKPKHKVRYCLIDSETGLTFHNYFSEEHARESMLRMSGNYHIAQEILDEDGIPIKAHVETDREFGERVAKLNNPIKEGE